MKASDDEKRIGIEVFYTDVEGIGGKLRSKPEDFRVVEIPKRISADEEGDYIILKVTSKNWEINHLVRELARKLGISRKRISFAGTKDRRALTTQLFSIYHPGKDLPEIKMKDVEIEFVCRSNKRMEIGDLIGNEFQIVI
ncbi:MAG: tRNA pseudouridine(13) synthase TruD, partial [Thermoplasmata archaeon]